MKQLFIHSSQFHVWPNVNDFNYVFYACPQLFNDVAGKSFGGAGIKEECSSDNSKCFKDEGIFPVHFSFVFYCNNVTHF